MEAIQCVVANLKESGIVEDIKTELIPLENKEEYELLITPTYKANVNDLVIRDIQLDKSFNIDEKIFLRELKKKKISPGTSFQPYTEIEFGIVAVLESLWEQSGRDWKDLNIWINLKTIDSAGIRITVTSEKPNCMR